MTNPGRRAIRFNSLDEVMADVERLRAGHTTVGQWSLAQICQHLAASMRLEVDMPASTRHDPAMQFDPAVIERVFATGVLPEGLPLPAPLASLQPVGEDEAVEQLREAIAYYNASPGPVAGHRFLGPLSGAQWEQLQRIHCAHHLSFAIPRAG